MNRREFLRNAAVLGAAGLVTPAELAFAAKKRQFRGPSILDRPARRAPIDTVVVLMMENRSFDHYLGWLATDEDYLENGRRLYGRRFRVDASNQQSYPSPAGGTVATHHLPLDPGEANPYRGCGHPDPGHGWNAGRAERDDGFLAQASGNDPFALGYYTAEDLTFYTALTRRFTVFDRYHCSLLGPTFPNREYLHSAQSAGIKNNALPFDVGYPTGFTWDTIWDRLIAAGVSVRYYFSDLPTTALWGPKLIPITSRIADYFADAAAGRLPNVVFLDPILTEGRGIPRTDEHPHGDVRDGQRFSFECIKAFVESPHWERGVFFHTYDEWGGFFDHVPPPILRDDLANDDDQENFGQAGFRVPTRMISPYARPGFVDHNVYDHTSILRFLEWRFLGAPAQGPGGRRASWFLTTRDRYANNIGLSLRPNKPDLEFDLQTPTTGTSPICGTEALRSVRAAAPPSDFERARDVGLFERMGYKIP